MNIVEKVGVARGRQVNQIHEFGHVESQNNRRVCLRRYMNVNEATSVCKDRTVRGNGVTVG